MIIIDDIMNQINDLNPDKQQKMDGLTNLTSVKLDPTNLCYDPSLGP